MESHLADWRWLLGYPVRMTRTDRWARPVEVKTLEPYRIWLRYDDGVEGEVDLSHLAGDGVFVAWDEPGFFQDVRLGSIGEVVWGNDIDLCGDALYLTLTGLSEQEAFGEHLRKPLDA